MNDFNNDGTSGGGFSAGKLAAVIALLTVGILGVIWYFVSGVPENRSAVPAAQQLFRPDTAPPGYNPASRAESTASGGSLEQLDAGYLKTADSAEKSEEGSGDLAKPQPAPVAKTKGRARKTAQKARAPAAGRPKLKTMSGFQSFADKKKPGPGAQAAPPGATMPDMTEIMKGIQQGQAPGRSGQ